MRVLNQAIKAGGSSLRDHRQTSGELGYFQHSFQVYDREGEKCQTAGCGGIVQAVHPERPLDLLVPEMPEVSSTIKRESGTMTGNWRDRAGTVFECQKQPASGSRGMVVSNHPLASAAGAEMLAAGGNAIDAAIATLFTLTVVEPMMVGIIGGGMAHIRLADGSHRFIDGQSTVPLSVRPDTYRSKPGAAHDVFDTVDDENLTGPKAVAVPGSLKAWCETLQRFGTMSLADVMQPAIKHAARGFRGDAVSARMHRRWRADMLKDKAISAIYLPNGTPLNAGDRVVQAEYARDAAPSSRSDGEAALYHGPLGDILRRLHEGAWRLHHARGSHLATRPSSARRSGETIAAGRSSGRRRPRPPACTSSQMLNILEGYDIAAMGFGTAETIHLLAEVLKIAFADRAAASGDPDFIKVPVERLISKDYAGERRRAIDPDARAALGRRRAAARRRAHHAHDRGRCDGQRGRDHADHQQSVRRQASRFPAWARCRTTT